MIRKQEITAIASALGLLPTTVEKDYVLSWILSGISQSSKISEWFFKGGTCLKKCYFETYTFSEDLDFTVPKGAIYSENDIKIALNDIANFVYENTGVNLQTREIEIKESINKRNRKTFIAKYTYLGPLNLPSRSQQRIKFDITDDEIIVDAHDMRDIFHMYSDIPDPPEKIKCYSVNEILAEKTRAIFERQGRARDIYDIVNISRNFREHINIDIAKNGLCKKFAFKSLPEPSVDLILSQLDISQLTAAWEDQLGHQLEVLPPAESFFDDLRPALSWWIDEHPVEISLPAIPHENGETSLSRVHFPESGIIQERRVNFRNPISTLSLGGINHIRYAARNRLCIEIEYKGVKRLVEPYSLRQKNTENLLLYAYELNKEGSDINQIKAYKVNEISNIVVQQLAFSPRYVVEL